MMLCYVKLTHQSVELELVYGSEGIVGRGKEGELSLLVQQLRHTCSLDGSNQEAKTTRGVFVCYTSVRQVGGVFHHIYNKRVY